LNITNISFSMKHLQLVVLSMYVKYPVLYQERFCLFSKLLSLC
jgi:hypothetical protein